MRRTLYILIAVLLSSCVLNRIQDEITEQVTDQPTEQPANVDFTYKKIAPLMVEFYNTSTGCATYRWDFGDGSWSEGKNATHAYDAIGSYLVTLTGTTSKGEQHTYQETITIKQPTVYIAGYTLYAIPYDNRYYKVVFKDDNLMPSSWDFQTSYTPMLTSADLPYSVALISPKAMTDYMSHEYYTIQVIRNESSYNSASEVSCLKGKLQVSLLTSTFAPEYFLRTESESTVIGIHMQYLY